MQNIEYILSLAASTTGLLITALTFIVKFIKNERAKRAAERIIDISNAVIPMIEEAERLTAYSGAQKKAYVLSKAKVYADEHSIPFDEEFTCDKIEEIINTTKKVNRTAS